MSEEIKILSDRYTKIIVETDDENPITIAIITNELVDPADGYRVRMTPQHD